jgi:hypothetical protein
LAAVRSMSFAARSRRADRKAKGFGCGLSLGLRWSALLPRNLKVSAFDMDQIDRRAFVA